MLGSCLLYLVASMPAPLPAPLLAPGSLPKWPVLGVSGLNGVTVTLGRVLDWF